MVGFETLKRSWNIRVQSWDFGILSKPNSGFAISSLEISLKNWRNPESPRVSNNLAIFRVDFIHGNAWCLWWAPKLSFQHSIFELSNLAQEVGQVWLASTSIPGGSSGRWFQMDDIRPLRTTTKTQHQPICIQNSVRNHRSDHTIYLSNVIFHTKWAPTSNK